MRRKKKNNTGKELWSGFQKKNGNKKNRKWKKNQFQNGENKSAKRHDEKSEFNLFLFFYYFFKLINIYFFKSKIKEKFWLS
jgi:hypothetical protein